MNRLLIIITLVAMFSIPASAQFWKRKVNQLDENGRKLTIDS